MDAITPNNTLNTIEPGVLQIQEYNFWKYETKMIVVSGICFVIASGCIAVLLIDGGKSCAIGNGVFSILGGIIGLMTGLFSSKSGKCASSRNNSFSV